MNLEEAIRIIGVNCDSIHFIFRSLRFSGKRFSEKGIDDGSHSYRWNTYNSGNGSPIGTCTRGVDCSGNANDKGKETENLSQKIFTIRQLRLTLCKFLLFLDGGNICQLRVDFYSSPVACFLFPHGKNSFCRAREDFVVPLHFTGRGGSVPDEL